MNRSLIFQPEPAQNMFSDPLSSDPGFYSSNRLYGQGSTGGNLHDTFRVDRYNNLYGCHTTIDLGNNHQVHMPWDPEF